MSGATTLLPLYAVKARTGFVPYFFVQSCSTWHTSNLCHMDNGSYKYCPPVLFGTKLLPDDKQEGSKYVSHSKGKSL